MTFEDYLRSIGLGSGRGAAYEDAVNAARVNYDRMMESGAYGTNIAGITPTQTPTGTVILDGQRWVRSGISPQDFTEGRFNLAGFDPAKHYRTHPTHGHLLREDFAKGLNAQAEAIAAEDRAKKDPIQAALDSGAGPFLVAGGFMGPVAAAGGLGSGGLAAIPEAGGLGLSGFGPSGIEALGEGGGAAMSGDGALSALDTAWSVNSRGPMFDWDAFLQNPDWSAFDAADPFGLGSVDGAGFDPGGALGGKTAMGDSLANILNLPTGQGEALFNRLFGNGASEGGGSTIGKGLNALKGLLGGSGSGALGGLMDGGLDSLALAALLGAGILENPDRTTTTNVTYPEWVSEGSRGALAMANQFAGAGTDVVAPLSANENQAAELARTSQGAWQPYVDQAGVLTGEAARGIPDIDLSAYMNPYTDSVLSPILRRGQEEKARALNDIGSKAGMRGAFGGSRHALLENLTAESADRNLNEVEAGVRGRAFDSALNTAGSDLNRKANAGAQFGALGGAMSKYYGDDISRLSTTGKTGRDVEQAKRNAPLTAIAGYRAAAPTNAPRTTTVTGPESSKIGQLTGALATLKGLS